jgi:hypothetical protein
MTKMSDEEVALELTKLYFGEIVRLGFKRKLEVDAVVNAYFYMLDRVKKKQKELALIDKVVEKDEAKLKEEIMKEYA